MYSQHDEEKYILEVFKDSGTGCVLDIGAFDGITFSNSARLIELGWNGVLVEPSAIVFTALLNRYRNNSSVVLINALLGADSDPKLMPFFDSNGDALSTTDPKHRDLWAASGTTFSPYLACSVGWKELIAAVGTDFDMLNLDAEGTSASLFLQCPKELLAKLRLVCVEHDNRISEIIDYASRFGIAKQLMLNGTNIILAR